VRGGRGDRDGAAGDGGGGDRAVPAQQPALRGAPVTGRARPGGRPSSAAVGREGRTARRAGRRALVYALLVLASLFFLLPVYLVVITAFKEPGEILLANTWRLPEVWSWSGFRTAWQTLAPKLRNSLVLAVTATALSALLGSLNGYVFS